MTVINGTARLADDAALLSTRLSTLRANCHHQKITAEILTISDELAKLSSTLWELNDAIDADPAQYTNAFNEDLEEISKELRSMLEEISECCETLRLADSNSSSVAWFFKKGRVARLLQHLEALKGTLLVMRTVLWHGKEYGTHRSDRIVEASPHVLCEDRVILESVVSQNRDAILDLHSLVNNVKDFHDRSKTSENPSMAGEHHRQLSEATGIDTNPIPDVLPPYIGQEQQDAGSPISDGSPEAVHRTFSKRGVRLGVHMSILDLDAHDAPDSLKKKWIQQANRRRHSIHEHNRPSCHHIGGLTKLSELSRISEVDTPAASIIEPCDTPSAARCVMMVDAAPEYFYENTQTPNKESQNRPNTPVECASSSRKNDDKIGNRLRKVVSKLSMANLRTPFKAQE